MLSWIKALKYLMYKHNIIINLWVVTCERLKIKEKTTWQVTKLRVVDYFVEEFVSHITNRVVVVLS